MGTTAKSFVPNGRPQNDFGRRDSDSFQAYFFARYLAGSFFGRFFWTNLSNYELWGEGKIDTSWRNIEFSNYLLEFFGKLARAFFGLELFSKCPKKSLYLENHDFLIQICICLFKF